MGRTASQKISKRNQEIRKLYESQKYNQKELAQLFNIKLGSISGIVSGIKRDRTKINFDNYKRAIVESKVNTDEAVELFVNYRWSINQLAKKYGVSRQRVHQKLQQRNVTGKTVKRQCIDCGIELSNIVCKRCEKCAISNTRKLVIVSTTQICNQCGVRRCKGTKFCKNCATINKKKRWNVILKLWNEDKLLIREIAAKLKTSSGSVYQDLVRMRKNGYAAERRK